MINAFSCEKYSQSGGDGSGLFLIGKDRASASNIHTAEQARTGIKHPGLWRMVVSVIMGTFLLYFLFFPLFVLSHSISFHLHPCFYKRVERYSIYHQYTLNCGKHPYLPLAFQLTRCFSSHCLLLNFSNILAVFSQRSVYLALYSFPSSDIYISSTPSNVYAFSSTNGHRFIPFPGLWPPGAPSRCHPSGWPGAIPPRRSIREEKVIPWR